MTEHPHADPASLNATVTLTGLSSHELGILLAALPAGAHFGGVVTRPALGGPRYELTVRDVSIQSVSDLTGALLTYASDLTP